MDSSSLLEAQVQLAADWQQRADRAALDALIMPLLPRILRAARRLSQRQAEDLAADGTIALIEAVGRWPGQSHGDLTAFVWPAVRGAMLQARLRGRAAVSVPERRLRDGLSGRLGIVQQDEFRALMRGETFEDGHSLDCSPASEDLTLLRERSRYLRLAIARALRPLNRIERRLIVTHLLHEAEGLETLADRLQLSPARARALEGRALHKMRNNLMTHGFLKSDLV